MDYEGGYNVTEKLSKYDVLKNKMNKFSNIAVSFVGSYALALSTKKKNEVIYEAKIEDNNFKTNKNLKSILVVILITLIIFSILFL